MYEVMNRNDDTFHSEHVMVGMAVAAAKTLRYAEVVWTENGEAINSVYCHGGVTCPDCGAFIPGVKTTTQCDGCWEADRDAEIFYRENAADMYGN